jgi:hypothetical protein
MAWLMCTVIVFSMAVSLAQTESSHGCYRRDVSYGTTHDKCDFQVRSLFRAKELYRRLINGVTLSATTEFVLGKFEFVPARTLQGRGKKAIIICGR